MTVAVTEGQAIYQVGDVVLVDTLEKDKLYRMYLNLDAEDYYIEDEMVSEQLATIIGFYIYDEVVYGYYLDEGTEDYVYTDEMFIGKIVAIDDIDNLEEDCGLLVTNDEASGVNTNILGKLVTFDKVLKRKGEKVDGMLSCLDLDDELISIKVDDTRLTISPEHIHGIVMCPNVELHESLKALQECCDLLIEEIGEEEFEEVFNEVATIALLEVLAEASNIEAEKLIRTIFGDEIEEGIEDGIEESEDSDYDIFIKWLNALEEEEEEECQQYGLDYNYGKHEISFDEDYGVNPIPYNIHIEKIIHQNPATIVFYRTGDYDEYGNFFVPKGSKLRKCVAKAQDGDVYDAEKGFAICMYKIFNRESARRLKELSK